MLADLTSKQRQFAKWVVARIDEGLLTETFYVTWPDRTLSNDPLLAEAIPLRGKSIGVEIDRGTLEVLGEENLLRVVADENIPKGRPLVAALNYRSKGNSVRCTVTTRLARAVARNFVDDVTPMSDAAVGAGAQFIPPEIVLSLARLRRKFPEQNRLGFLIMRFAAAKPFSNIIRVIKDTGVRHGLDLIRADENEFHSDLWNNVRTHLHGCAFGVAVIERIETDEPNANIGMEVGYLFAMNKPVLLLKDKTVAILQADLAGKLYKPFDPFNPEESIPPQMTKWLEDYGIVLSENTGIDGGKVADSEPPSP